MSFHMPPPFCRRSSSRHGERDADSMTGSVDIPPGVAAHGASPRADGAGDGGGGGGYRLHEEYFEDSNEEDEEDESASEDSEAGKIRGWEGGWLVFGNEGGISTGRLGSWTRYKLYPSFAYRWLG